MRGASACCLTGRLTAGLTARELLERTAETRGLPCPVPMMGAGDWIGVWRAGPDAGASITLPTGRHLLGRAHTATLRCDDQSLQPYHALVEVGPGAMAQLTQLTGRAAMRIDGNSITGTVELTSGAVIEVGASTLVLVAADAEDSVQPASFHAGALLRAPRTVPSWTANDPGEPGEPPLREDSHGGLTPAILGLAGAGAIALVLDQPMFLLFGALGATVAMGSWFAQRIAALRRFRAASAAYDLELAAREVAAECEHLAWRRHQLATVPTIDAAVRMLVQRSEPLWNRRATHPDAYTVAIGMHAIETDIPVPVDLGPGCRVALLGPSAYSVARSLVLQLASSCGPADVRITIVTNRAERWQSMRALPHLALPDGTAAIVAESGLSQVLDELAGQGAHHVLITDQPTLLATRTSPLRRATSDPQRDALVVVLPFTDPAAEGTAPHICNSVLTTSAGPTARWVSDVQRTMLPQPIGLVGVGDRVAARCAAAVRGLVDPEDPLSAASGMPRQLSLAALLQRDDDTVLTATAIAAAWSAAAADPTPRTAIGMAADGVVDIDLVRDGPHGLIAGTTGAGKSELLRCLVVGMSATTSPQFLTFVLVDYKGGATFDACSMLPHVVGMVTDLDDQLADRALRSLHAELRRREAVLREHCVADLSELRARAPSVVLPRLVVVIDEFAALVAEQPAFLHALVGVAQRGRSLGVHLLLATQRPNGVITDDIRANTNLRLALRLQDTSDAIDVVGIADAAHLPRGLPGRAVLRLGAEDHLTFQAAQCTAPTLTGRDTELAVLVRAICDAARLLNLAQPTAPWQPPLPTTLDRDDLPSEAVAALGLIDEPDLQRSTPLRWSLRDGRLAVVGSAGSGVTSTLLTLVDHTLTGPDKADVYVIDARADSRWAQLETHPRCVAVVQLHESERLHRLLHRLRARVHHPSRDVVPTMLVVDGLDALRRALDDVVTAAEFDVLEQVLGDAECAGITIVAGAESANALPMSFLSRCPARWVLHLHDPHDAALLGVKAKNVPAAVPGRVVLAGPDSMAQLVAPRPLTLPTSAAAGVAKDPAIAVVPGRVVADLLPRSCAADHTTLLHLGVDFASGDALPFEVPDGEHLLLVGGARTGRSTGLGRIAAGWLQAHRDGWVGAIVPRRSTFPRDLAARCASDPTSIDALLDELMARLTDAAEASALLVVDDAEAVDDPTGRLSQLALRGRGLCIAAAGRPEALRQAYGHWTGVVRRSRLGMVATGGNDLDGDLLGTLVPRRSPVPARPGLWWVVGDGPVRLVQMAC